MVADRDPSQAIGAPPLAAGALFKRQQRLEAHLQHLRGCRRCPKMLGPVITPQAVLGEIYVVGQAPGGREGVLGRPFAWTAGRTLFRWFAACGVSEVTMRTRTFISAACRCFPGKLAAGGDRAPSKAEIVSCSSWMREELELLQPTLVITVGRVGTSCFLPVEALSQTIGRLHQGHAFGRSYECLPLPHPSGASTWWRRPPGAQLLQQALELLAEHPSWQRLRACEPAASVTASRPS